VHGLINLMLLYSEYLYMSFVEPFVLEPQMSALQSRVNNSQHCTLYIVKLIKELPADLHVGEGSGAKDVGST